MLEPILHNILSNKKIILASGSPRRKEILSNIGLKFDVLPSKFDESSLDRKKYDDNKKYVLDLAEHKVLDVYNELKKTDQVPDLIIGADTIVELNNTLLGKPQDKKQAVDFLNLLNGKSHTVHTAIVIKAHEKTKSFVESTVVSMAPLSPKVIDAYVATGDPLDKAGAYGIQGLGGSLIEKIEGDYYNVTGLPLHRFCVNLQNLIEELEFQNSSKEN